MTSANKAWGVTVVLMLVAIVALNGLTIWRLMTPKTPNAATLADEPDEMLATFEGSIEPDAIDSGDHLYAKIADVIKTAVSGAKSVTVAEYVEPSDKRRVIYGFEQTRLIALPLENGAGTVRVDSVTFLPDDGVIILENNELGVLPLSGCDLTALASLLGEYN